MVQENNNNKKYIVIRAMLHSEIMIKFSPYSQDDTADEVQPNIGSKTLTLWNILGMP
jgi:hypothetical protein